LKISFLILFFASCCLSYAPVAFYPLGKVMENVVIYALYEDKEEET